MKQQVIVLDSGFWEMKIGFCGDEAPRYLERSLIGYSKNLAITSSGENREILVGEKVLEKQNFLDIKDCLSQESEWELRKMEIIWNEMFYQKMCIDITEFAMCISLSSFFNEKMKTELAENLFENFNVPSIYLMTSNIGGIYSEGKTTGLVLDSGMCGTYLLNIFEGYPIEDNLISSEKGGKFWNLFLQKELEKELLIKQRNKKDNDFFSIYGYEIPYQQLDKIKIEGLNNNNGVDIILPDEEKVHLNQNVFQSIENEMILHYSSLLKDIIQNSEEQYVKEWKNNIYFQGSNCLLKNLEKNVQQQLLNENLEGFKIYQRTQDEKKLSGWIGASLFSSMSTFYDLGVSKQEYEEQGSDCIMMRNLI